MLIYACVAKVLGVAFNSFQAANLALPTKSKGLMDGSTGISPSLKCLYSAFSFNKVSLEGFYAIVLLLASAS